MVTLEYSLPLRLHSLSLPLSVGIDLSILSQSMIPNEKCAYRSSFFLSFSFVVIVFVVVAIIVVFYGVFFWFVCLFVFDFILFCFYHCIFDACVFLSFFLLFCLSLSALFSCTAFDVCVTDGQIIRRLLASGGMQLGQGYLSCTLCRH